MTKRNRRFKFRYFILVFLPVLVLTPTLYIGARHLFVRPSTDRLWKEEHKVPADVRFDGNLVHIRNVRNFVYRSSDDFDAEYYDRTYDLEGIESVWFVLSPFRDNWRGPAHSFISFGFADSQFVAISVEARKEVGENYSLWKGILNTFELLYVIGDERDLIGLRAVHWNDDVYVYPIKATKERIRDLFVAMLERANLLRESPEFYNTVTNNCTTNIYDHAKALSPGKWSYSWKIQLSGYMDELLFEKGLIATELSLEEARKRFRVNERAVQHLDSPEFSALIR